ncbi:MAG: hypothetical protein ACYDCK_01885 [Thermoplasmatota archaeon]
MAHREAPLTRPAAPTVLFSLAILCSFLLPLAAAAFPQSAPNDPDYAPAENPSPDTCFHVSVNSEEYYLYSFMPRCAKNAHDAENASGMSADATWAQYTPGSPDVTIAYIEGGINWHAADAKDLANQVFINKGELPLPEDANGTAYATYDANGDGVFNVRDYANDPRVSDCNGNGFLDPEDLICAFSDGVDNDHNGFVDDISGWDFYDHQNDPATVDATYDHANGQMEQAAAEANNNFGGVGVCPGCRVLPIKAGAEALDRDDDLAQAWLYADHIGAKVVVSVTADLGYTTFMRQVVDKLWYDGVALVQASNDFDSTDHQGGMFWPHVLPGNGFTSNTNGMQAPPLENGALTTYRARSGLTSWGTHSMFTVSTQGGSTSESTPTVGGAVGLVLSAGRALHPPLTGAEAIQVMRATASDVNDPNSNWPSHAGWDLQFGYGRPNLLKAAQAVAAGDIPPTPSLDAPRWYALYDPTVTHSIPVSAHLDAKRSPSYTWTLEYALGADPADGNWTTFASGANTHPQAGPLANFDLTQIPASFYDAPFKISSTKTLETNEQYTVTLRLRMVDASGRMGEERRTIAVHHDPTLMPGFPVNIGSGGESQPALVDLQGRGNLAVVFGDADGRVHAIDGRTGHELPGWPVTTNPTQVAPGFGDEMDDIDPGHEPILAPVAVGDLFHTGHLDVVATSTTGTVYVFDENGARVAGFPKSVCDFAVTPPIPRPAMDYTRLPHCGATASPVLFDLDGQPGLEILQAAWDGHLYAWHADGSALAGWPVDVALPASYTPFPGHVIVHDYKLDVTPTIADLDGSGHPDIVVRSQMSDVIGAGLNPDGVMHLFAFHADGTPVAGFPNSLHSVVEYYGSAQEFITEGSETPTAADVDHTGRDAIAAGPWLGPTYLVDGTGNVRGLYGPAPNPFAEALAGTLPASLTSTGDEPTDAPVSFSTTGAFGKLDGATLTYAQGGVGAASTAGALLLTGSGLAIKNYERAYDAATGAPHPGFPALSQGLDFLGGPAIADVTGDGLPDVIDGADSSALLAWNAAGLQADAFPKFTTGWTVFTPAIGDLTGDGHNDVVTVTREGYLMAWSTPGLATANDEWWGYHHDEWRTGLYGVDSRAPGALAGASLSGATLTFRAPGDNGNVGTVAGYRIVADGVASFVPSTIPAGGAVSLALPRGASVVTVQAVDHAGNLGYPMTLSLAPHTALPLVLVPGVALVAGIAARKRGQKR